VIFWVFFVPLNIFWAFPGFVFALKNILKKKEYLPYRIGPSQRPDPTCPARSAPAQSQRPAKAPPGPAARPEAMAFSAGGAATPACAPRSLGVRTYLSRGRARGRTPYPAAKPCAAPCPSPLRAAPPSAKRRRRLRSQAPPRHPAGRGGRRSKLSPPYAPRRRATPSAPLPVASRALERRHRTETGPATMADRRRPLRNLAALLHLLRP
jgi:hypothetical protein